MPFTSFDRRVFIVKTRLSVAYSNFTLNMAFGRYPAVESVPKYAAYFATAIMVVVMLSLAPRLVEPPKNFHNFAAFQKSMEHRAARTPAPREVPPPPAPQQASLPSIPLTTPSIQEAYPTYALAVDKSKKVLLVLKSTPDYFEVVKVYDISLGRKIGTKEEKGDLKTPSGYYQIVDIKEGRDLPSYYGPKAFVTNYPNSFDVASGRSGGGIWVHGSKGEKRNLDSHGCVVLDNKNLLRLETWVRKSTPIAIFPEEFSLPVVDGKVEKKYISTDFFYGEQAKTINRLTDRGSPG